MICAHVLAKQTIDKLSDTLRQGPLLRPRLLDDITRNHLPTRRAPSPRRC
jgi:hypothetical protein